MKYDWCVVDRFVRDIFLIPRLLWSTCCSVCVVGDSVVTCVCVFQGLTHLGKGTLTLCPYHSDRQLMSQVAVAGLLTVLVSFLDVKNSKSISAAPVISV